MTISHVLGRHARRALALATTAATLAFSACGGPTGAADTTVHLSVATQDWSEFTPSAPESVAFSGEVGEGQVVTVVAVGNDVDLTVVEIGEGVVRVETRQQMLPHDDPVELTRKFTVTADEPLRISTASLDSGTDVIITLTT